MRGLPTTRAPRSSPQLGVGIEFVRRRQVVRLPATDNSPAVEVPLREFLDLLGVRTRDLVPTRQFLLFAGTSDRALGGAADLAGTFADEQAGRAAFEELRRSPEFARGWAELVALDVGGGARSTCWFGRSSGLEGANPVRHPASGKPVSPVSVSPRVAGGRRWPGRKRRATAAR